ncbi:putative nuclease HARBI1 [Anopheles coustani]|uniref:putative nuclease HARBI1 n=1 Tax=Anopheles coustani TaxID=139045 RepID=UPI00265B0664|nr:putative nuclease HARBI1 [Anopheles coustani]
MILASFVNSSSDDSDEEQGTIINLASHRRMIRTATDALELPDRAFIKSFRESKDIFVSILRDIEPRFAPVKGRGLTVKEKLAAALRFLAEGSYQHGVGQDYVVAIAQPTFSASFQAILDAMEATLCPKWISLEMSSNEKQEARRYFFRKSEIPGIVMCVDGTHVPIIAPKINKDQFYNRKGFSSLNVMMLCDHQMNIRYVNARYGGANHDAHVWTVSNVDSYFEAKHRNGETAFRVLGDSAYPSKPWLVTPKRNAAHDTPEARYNSKHVQGREIVERTFGLLKSRFRCLSDARQLHYAPQKAAQIVNLCSALHNLKISQNV